MSEGSQDRGILAVAKLMGGKGIKIHVTEHMQRGTPDLLIQIPGYPTMFVEDKLSYNHPSKIQVARLKQWGKVGMATAVVWSVDDFKNFVRYTYEKGAGYHGGFRNGNHIHPDNLRGR